MKKEVYLLAILAAMLAGCAKNDISDVNASGSRIAFDAYSGFSKAVETTNANISDFTVFGVDNTGGTSGNVARIIPALGNERYSSSNFSAGPWVPSSATYGKWSDVKTTGSFYAFAPWDLNPGSGSLALQLNDASTSAAIKTFSYTVPTTATQQVDFVAAASKDLVTQKINLTFYHALSQVRFVVAVPASQNIYVEVADINIKNVYQSATFDFNEVTSGGIGTPWSSLSTLANYSSGAKNGSNAISTSNPIQLTPVSNSVNVTTLQSGNNLMLLPQIPQAYWTPTSSQSVGSAAYVSVTYRMYYSTDGGSTKTWLMGGASSFVTAGFPLAATNGVTNALWEAGKIYTYTITLGDGSGNSGGGGFNPGPGNITDPSGETILPGEPLLGRNIMFTVDVNTWTSATGQTVN